MVDDGLEFDGANLPRRSCLRRRWSSPISGPTRADPMATDREINCPSAGKSVSAYRETGMSASTSGPMTSSRFDRVDFCRFLTS